MNQKELYETLVNYNSADEVEKWLAENDFAKFPFDQGPYEALWARVEADTTGNTLHVSILRGRQAAPIAEYGKAPLPLYQPSWIWFGAAHKPAAH
jgi:hypothetical protein